MIDYSFKQSDTAKQFDMLEPTFRWNGQTAFASTGDRVLESESFAQIVTDKQACTIYMVVEGDDTQVVSTPAFLHAQNDNARFLYRYTDSVTSSVINIFHIDDSGNQIGKIDHSLVDTPHLPKHILCFRNNGTAGGDQGADSFIGDVSNKASDNTWNTSDNDVTLEGGTTYFLDSDNVTFEPFVGESVGLWVYDEAHTDAQVDRGMTYLRDTYFVDGWGFNGTSSVSTITDDDLLDLDSSAFSVAMWIHTVGIGVPETNYFFSLNALPGVANSMNCYLSGSDKAEIRIADGEADSFSLTSTSDVATTQGWQHIAVVRSGDTVELYINGTVEDSDTNSDVGTIVSSNGLRLGNRIDLGSGKDFKGTMRDVAMWPRALTSGNISELVDDFKYATEIAGDAPAWNLRMEAADASANGETVVGVGDLVVTNTQVDGVYL